MIPRTLAAVNLALAALAALLVLYIGRQFVAPTSLPVGGRRAAAPTASAAAIETARSPASAYNVVASRNLFSPTRTEAPSSGVIAATPATAAGTPQPSVAPALPGVIPPTTAPPMTTPPHAVGQPPMQPGQPPGTMIPTQPPTVAVPGQPPVVTPPAVPGRRPLPPNLMRRLPPGMGDAPQQ